MADTETKRLTQTVKCAGCAYKLHPTLLYEALKNIQWPQSEKVLVGFDEADDAGVYQIAPDKVLVATTDFFTPVVDDPYDYGRIAATNAFSDIYAMGARPLFALNIVCFPRELGPEVLHGILRGGADVAAAAKSVVIGGHSVEGPELKYGMAVIGEAHPRDIKTIGGAKVGDALILTKALGTGVLNTAVKKGVLHGAPMEQLISSMTRLNESACAVMLEHGAHGCTDITGFGLAGHGMEMAKAANACLTIDTKKIPLLSGVESAVAQGCLTRGDRTNREYAGSHAVIDASVSPLMNHLVFDPQTSGGLLIALPQNRAEDCVRALRERGDAVSAIVGSVESSSPGTIRFI